MTEIPGRSETIRLFKASGGHVAVVTPIAYPRALLRAHGFLPVEMWGPPLISTSAADQHVQAYACSIVRSILAYVLKGGARQASVLLMPHACDSLQGITGILQNHADAGLPVLPMYTPRTTGPGALGFLEQELRRLGDQLSAISGVKPSAERLQEAVALEEQADGVYQQLLTQVLPATPDSHEVYKVLRCREYLPAMAFMDLARDWMAGLPGGLHRDPSEAGQRCEDGRSQAVPGVPLVVSGVLPEPMSLLQALQSAGGRVVADDLACCGRRVGPPGSSDEPYRRMAEAMLALPPDPMRGSPIEARIERLRSLCAATSAKGVLFWVVKYCEQELFDLPLLNEALRGDGRKTLTLELEVTQPLPAQAMSRLEAFCEMLS